MTSKVLEKVTTPITEYFDCSTIRSPEGAATRARGSILLGLGKFIFGQKKQEAAKDLIEAGYRAASSPLLAGDLFKPGIGTAAC